MSVAANSDNGFILADIAMPRRTTPDGIDSATAIGLTLIRGNLLKCAVPEYALRPVVKVLPLRV